MVQIYKVGVPVEKTWMFVVVGLEKLDTDRIVVDGYKMWTAFNGGWLFAFENFELWGLEVKQENCLKYQISGYVDGIKMVYDAVSVKSGDTWIFIIRRVG
jgi:hypothetical protein